jgi:hypothetical protein
MASKHEFLFLLLQHMLQFAEHVLYAQAQQQQEECIRPWKEWHLIMPEEAKLHESDA